jgi:hypothetical protein
MKASQRNLEVEIETDQDDMKSQIEIIRENMDKRRCKPRRFTRFPT